MRTLTFLILALSTHLGHSQSYSTNGTDTTFFGNATDSDFDAKFILYNDSTTAFPMSWEVVGESVQNGWSYSICDPSNCYPIGVSNAIFSLSLSANNRIMNLHYYPNGNTGQSTVSVKLWPTNSPADSVILTWTGVVSTASLKDSDPVPDVSVYPNPSNGTFTLSSSQLLTGGITVIDLQGKVVYDAPVNSNSHIVSFEAESGFYLLSYTSSEGTVHTRKLIVE